MSYGYGAPTGPPPPSYGYGPGGYGGSPPSIPAGADPQLWMWFTTLDSDRSGSITVVELEKALMNGDWTPFDLDTCKLLMSIFDVDRTGTIGFNEFAGLWKYIKDWQNVFRYFDRDRSGTIDSGELHDALRQFGYNLSPHLVRMVERKYASTVVIRGGPPPGITFDRFVRACVVIKQMTESFRKLDTNQDGWVQINYDQFVETVLNLP